MSRLKVYHPAANDVHDGHLHSESLHEGRAILSFVLDGRRLRAQAQFSLAQRARLLRANSSCPQCDRAQVIPLFSAIVADTCRDEATVNPRHFACEGCGVDWVA